MSLSLDDLRHPELRSRLLGYDRDEVERLLGMVVVALESLQRRRQRDATALEQLSQELDRARARMEAGEERAAQLSIELDRARRDTSVATQRARAWEQRATEAGARADQAEQALAAERAATGSGDEELLRRLPLAQRAARAVLREARAQAAAIVRQAEQEAGASAGGGGVRAGYSRSGSSEAIPS